MKKIKKITTCISIDANLYKKVRIIAAEKGVRASTVYNEILRERFSGETK